MLVTLLSSGAWFTPLAVAQAQRPDTAASNDSVQQDDPAPIDTIVVSARRKDETLVDVPASITAYSADFLQKQNITSFADYATKVPNLSFQYGQGGSLLWSGSRQTTIRGVVGNETTAYYINDTPVPASVSPQALNLDRIEVLKGPQGTLFGASSMGGNLRYITKAPSLSADSGIVQLQGGSTRHGAFDADANAQTSMVLVPDRIALNLAAGYTRESGYVSRRFPDSQGNLVTRDGQGRTDVFSASATLRARLSDSLEMTLSAIGQSSKLHGFPASYAHLPVYVPTSLTVDRDQDIQEGSKDRWGIGSMVLKYTGDGVSVVSSTSYFKRKMIPKDPTSSSRTSDWISAMPPSPRSRSRKSGASRRKCARRSMTMSFFRVCQALSAFTTSAPCATRACRGSIVRRWRTQALTYLIWVTAP
jgi:outer membrane receptor protein involved in Fe transport